MPVVSGSVRRQLLTVSTLSSETCANGTHTSELLEVLFYVL